MLLTLSLRQSRICGPGAFPLMLLPVCALNVCTSTLEYFREALNESWTNSQQMFEAFDKCVEPIAAGAC